MSEQSHREEMSAAIRAQRERNAAQRLFTSEPEAAQAPSAPPEPEVPAAEPERKRLFGRRRTK